MSFRKLEEQYPEVAKWISAVTTKGSTREIYLRGMGGFIAFSGLRPAEMLKVKKEGLKQGEVRTVVEDKLVEWIRFREKKYSRKTIKAEASAVTSFLTFNGLQLPKRIAKVAGRESLELREPEQAEVEALISYAHDLEKKTLITLMAESPCRPRVFAALRWGWLEEGWESKDIANIRLPKEFRPTESGPRKFEPIAFIGKCSIDLLKRLRDQRGAVKAEDRVFPYTHTWFKQSIRRIFQRCIEEKAVRASRPEEQTLSLKSFRKYVFNAIDACRDISPEWRSMLKGRDLGVEKYYSKENIEELREVYRSRVYPQIWKREEPTKLDRLRQQLELWGYNPDEILKEEGVKKLASARKAIKHGGPRVWQFEYEWTEKEKEEILQERIRDILERRGSEHNGGKPFESKIVTEDELVQYVEEGWEICRELSNGKIVIRRPPETE